ncbi:MAG: putative N-acetylmannosaminyltransferase [Pseudomonadota bacterium]|jgi:N-acetylglucosaminyldiphosphoundecaprenol N-acetyl-beta-D-mannosaminyltransferase
MSSPEPSLSRHESGPPESSAGAARFNGELNGGLEMIELLGMQLASCSEAQLLDTLFDSLARQRGGWLITANLDFLRRFCRDERMQVLYSEADLRVADGMPLIWAAYLRGTPLPERIAGSSLIRPMAKRAAAESRRIYFLGGEGRTAEAAAKTLAAEYPGLAVAGFSSPWLPTEPDDAAVEPTRQALTEARPDIVLVALGSPKQEWLISKLRRSLPACWFIGVGMSFSFTTGQRARAPQWMQRTGLEWVHRLASEPRRLGKRYLWHDAPFGIELLGKALIERLKRRPTGRSQGGHAMRNGDAGERR